jgi:predicted membrane protein
MNESGAEDAKIELQVWDWNLIQTHKSLGSVTIELKDVNFVRGKAVIMNKKLSTCGEIVFDITALNFK